MDAHFFPHIDFENLTEADVREEVIGPVLRRLGYRSGTHNNISRERHLELRYPHLFLGRKKMGKDPVLQGRPDYICEARGVTRWAVEAKPPSSDISRHDIEQAHSYAVHPELAAPLYVLSNGRDWQIFESNRGPASDCLVRLSYDQLRDQFHVLENLLSPSALARRYPVQVPDYGRPLAPDFGSKALIVGGFTRYDAIDWLIEGLPPGAVLPEMDAVKKLVGYQVAITGENCSRDEQAGIVADIRMHHPHDKMRRYAEQIGLARNRYITREATISTDQAHPTIFEFTIETTLPANEPLLNVVTWSEIVSPVPIHMVCYAEATGYLEGSKFRGTYSSRMLAEPKAPIQIRQWTFMRGTFEVELRSI